MRSSARNERTSRLGWWWTTPLLLVLVAVPVYASHVRLGGYFYDDWLNAANMRFADGDWRDRYRTFYSDSGARPLSALWGSLVWHELWSHPQRLATLAIALAVTCATAFAWMLRRADVGGAVAAAAAGLWLVTPLASSTRFWASASTANVVGTLLFVGVGSAIAAVRAERRRTAICWHVLAAVTYLAAMLWAEIGALIILATPVLLRAFAPWRVVLVRWVVDLAIVVPTMLFVAAGNRIPATQGLDDLLDHALAIARRGTAGFGAVFAPGAGSAAALWIGAVALLVLVAGAVLARRGGPGIDATDVQALTRAGALAAAGAVVVVLAYAVYVPAEAAYLPLGEGVHDRHNFLASFGYVLFAVGVVLTAARLVFRDDDADLRWRTGATVVLMASIAATSLVELERRGDSYVRADRTQHRILRDLELMFPDARSRPGTTYYVFNHREWVDDVPVFAGQWDLDGAVRLRLDDGSLHGFPLGPYPDARLECTEEGVRPTGTFFADRERYDFDAPYGRARIVDSGRRIGTPIDSREICAAVAPGVEDFFTKAGAPSA